MGHKARALFLAGALLLIAAAAAQAAGQRTNFTRAQELSPPPSPGTGFSEPALAGAPDGSSVAAWVARSGGPTTVQAAWITVDGERGPVINVGTEPAAHLDTAVLENGTAIVTWTSAGEVRFATVAPDGAVGPARTLGGGKPPVVETRQSRAIVAWASENQDRLNVVTLEGAAASEVGRDQINVGRSSGVDSGVAIDPGQLLSVLFIQGGNRVMRAEVKPSGNLKRPLPIVTRKRSSRTYFTDLDADTDSLVVAVKRAPRSEAPGAIVYADLWPEVSVTTVASRRATGQRDIQLDEPDVESHRNGSATVVWTTQVMRNGETNRWVAAAKAKTGKATEPAVLSTRNVDARSPAVETVIAGATVLWRSDRGVQWASLPGGKRGKGRPSRARTIPGTEGFEIREPSLVETGPNLFATWAQNSGPGGRGEIAGSVGARGD